MANPSRDDAEHPNHGDEEPRASRRTILARRARFIAAAMASAGLAGAGYACTCLSVVRQPDGPPTVDTEPADGGQPPVTEGLQEAGAQDDGAGGQGAGGADGVPDAGVPQPCLSPAGPRICLSDDPIEGELIKPNPRPEICLEAPFD